jgi:hypothetical protein
MNCKICSHSVESMFSAKIMNKYNINYFYCDNCNFLSTEEPYWLEEVYSSPISKFDTGHIQRNINISKKLVTLLTIFFKGKKIFVDYAGGNGVLVRLMRDVGFNFLWEDKYATNLFSEGFEWNSTLKSEVEAVTVIECFEHFVNPIEEIEKIITISKNIIFTTELLPPSIPHPNDWWYFTLERGGHISFYSEKTLQYIANKYKLNYFNLGSIHILTERNNITNFKLKILKLNRLGLAKLLSKLYRSKTFGDYQHVCLESKKKIQNG